MALIRSCLSRRVRFAMNQALRPSATPSPSPTPTPGLGVTAMPPPPPLGAPIGSFGGLVSSRHLRVTTTPPPTPPMPPMNLRYNYAAGVFIVVLFTWAALTPEDDGFNSLLRGGVNDDGDDDDDDDDDERYDGTGYEGRDKALASSSGGSGGNAGGVGTSRGEAAAGRPVAR